MSMKKMLISITTIIIIVTSQLYSQDNNYGFGAGVSLGLASKAQFYVQLSEKSQLSLDLGYMLIADEVELGNLGLTFKHAFKENELSPYIGFSAALLSINEEEYYIHIPLGLQKKITNDLLIFCGYNPGIIFTEDNNDVIFGAEIGIEYLF